MIFLKLVIGDNKIDSWIESEGIKVSSILMILKKNLGYKNQREICKKTYLDSSFLRIKLCWKTEQEYSELTNLLNGLVSYYSYAGKRSYYYHGKVLLNIVEKAGNISYVPYYRAIEENGEKSLAWFTVEKTIERWINEKF